MRRIPSSLLLTVLLGLTVGASVSGNAQATQKDPIAGYRNWTKVNPKPIYLAPEIAMLCIGPASWDADPDNPHVPNYFTVYVNAVGESAMLSGQSAQFPVGTVIVKEKLKGKGSNVPKLLTVMIKGSQDRNANSGGWKYMTVDGDLTRRSGAKSKVCQSCHSSQKSDDFVYRTYVNAYTKTRPKALDRFGGMSLSSQILKLESKKSN